MTKQKRLLMWAIFITSLVHIVGTAISPALNQMKTIAFPQHSLSPVIFTNLTDAIVKDSTGFRYQFVAFFALACGIVVAIMTYVRSKKARKT